MKYKNKDVVLKIFIHSVDFFGIVRNYSDDIDNFLYLLEEKQQEGYKHFLFSACGGYFSFDIEDGIFWDLIKYKKTNICSINLKKYILNVVKEAKDDYEKKEEYFKEKKEKDGYIYVIKSNDLYKIGRSKQIKDRIKTYRTENPFGIDVIFQSNVHNYIGVEKILLNKFRKKVVRGEWFNLNQDDLNVIIDIIRNYEIHNND